VTVLSDILPSHPDIPIFLFYLQIVLSILYLIEFITASIISTVLYNCDAPIAMVSTRSQIIRNVGDSTRLHVRGGVNLHELSFIRT
jgi:hypothetical protein